jgi:cystine transport system substrate-binding protein
MNQIKLVVAGAVALLGAIAISGHFSDPAPSATDKATAAVGSSTLRIGVDSTEPVYYESGGATKGFDYEMAHSVAEGMGVEPEFVAMDFNELFPALRAGKIDMIGAQVTSTSELEREFDFSAPYFSTYVAFLTPKGSTIRTRGDVNGKRIAVIDGAIQGSYLEEKYHDVEIVRAPDVGAAIELIERGEADALFHGAPYARLPGQGRPDRIRDPLRRPAQGTDRRGPEGHGPRRRVAEDQDRLLRGRPALRCVPRQGILNRFRHISPPVRDTRE